MARKVLDILFRFQQVGTRILSGGQVLKPAKLTRIRQSEKNIRRSCNVDTTAYSKIEKGSRALTVDELQKMAQLFNMTADQILNYDGGVPKKVVFEDKTVIEQ